MATLTADNFKYQDYLNDWEDRFGDDEYGEYGYYLRGKHIPYTVKKLSEKEFEEHVRAVVTAWDAFDVAYKANDDSGMDKALGEAFPHELVLLC